MAGFQVKESAHNSNTVLVEVSVETEVSSSTLHKVPLYFVNIGNYGKTSCI